MHRLSLLWLSVFGVASVAGEGQRAVVVQPTMPHMAVGGITYGGAPTPTAPPSRGGLERNKKRQGDLTSVCGISTDDSVYYSYTCGNAGFCGFNIDASVFGCCSAVIQGTLSGCYLPSTCVDSSTADEDVSYTDSAHLWNTYYCTESQSPYCGTYYESGLSAFGCFDTPDQTVWLAPINEVLTVTATATATTRRTTTATTATPASVRSSIRSSTSGINSFSFNPSSRSSLTSPRNPFSATSTFGVPLTTPSGSTLVSQATSATSSALGVGLGRSVETLCGLLMSLVYFLV